MKLKTGTLPDDYFENEPLPPGEAKGKWEDDAVKRFDKRTQELEDMLLKEERESES